ncbi:MAG: multiple sugar transport system substrate-binding protein [Thermomicrobiales bacterium]|nr:multiple sugar transport system substrate-binding protein [Thermomicrobiales bacterium]
MAKGEDVKNRIATSGISRRRFAQGLAATPLVVGAAARGTGRVRAQDKVTIRFWTHTHPPMVDLNKQLIEQFQAANPDIEVQYDIIPNNEFATKMLTSMGTGTGPDVINMDDNQMRSIYIPRGLVQPVDPAALGYGSMEELQAAYIPGTFEGAAAEGQVYGLPSEFNVTAFAINTAAFQEAGLDPNAPPKTWEEVGTMGQKLVVKDGDTLTRRGFDFLYLHAGWYHNQLGTLMLQTGGTYVAEDGKTVTVNQPPTVQALQIWYDLIYKHKVADPNVASREATVPYQDFLDGKVAMSLLNPWGMGLVTPESAVYEKYQVVPLPQVNPDAAATPLYAYYWAVNSQTTDEAKRQAAFKWVAFLASQPGPWLKNVNFIQPKLGWNELPEAKEFPFYDIWAGEMLKGKFLPVTPQAQEVDNIMKQTIESSLLTGVEPQEALDAAAPQIEAVLEQG